MKTQIMLQRPKVFDNGLLIVFSAFPLSLHSVQFALQDYPDKYSDFDSEPFAPCPTDRT